MPEFNVWYTLLVIACVLGFLLGAMAYFTLLERKVSAWVQDRVGPNRVGPWGLLQPLVDGGKFFLKEEVIPSNVDKAFYLLAPVVALGTALVGIAVVPFGGTTPPPAPVASVQAVDGRTVPAADPVGEFDRAQAAYREDFQFVIAPGLDIGVLYVFAIGSLAVYGVILAGWSANNKYALLGSLRSSAQIISYEIPLGMSVLGVVLLASSLNPETVIAGQGGPGQFWNVVFQPLAFLLFMTSVFAECNRLPFDLPEAEQELVGGFHTEYSSLKLGMLLLAEYAHMTTASFLMAVLFLGGWHLFGLEDFGAVAKLLILGGKMFAFIMLFMLVRWTIPRFRFDQLMSLAWKVMIPLALLNLLCVMLAKQFGWSPWVLTGTSLGLFVLAGAWGVASGGNVSAPKRRVRRLPPGLPEGVTYAGR